MQGSHTISNTKFQDFSRTFQGFLDIFQGLFFKKKATYFEVFITIFFQISHHAY